MATKVWQEKLDQLLEDFKTISKQTRPKVTQVYWEKGAKKKSLGLATYKVTNYLSCQWL